MHHGGINKGKGMTSEGKIFTVPDNELSVLIALAEELFNHFNRFSVADDLCLGVVFEKVCNVCAVVGLHMLNNKVVGLA